MTYKTAKNVVMMIVVGFIFTLFIDALLPFWHLNTSINDYYGTILIPLLGGSMGLYYYFSKKITEKNYRMLACIVFSSTLIAWSVGTIFFNYYFAKTASIPYPSVADVAYFICGFLSVLGTYYLALSLGVKDKLKELPGKVIFLALSMITFGLTYDLYFHVIRQDLGSEVGLFKFFLDIFYPMTDALNLLFISAGCLLVKERWSIKWTPIVFFYVGITFSYIANFFFSYSTTNNTYVVGNWIDLLFSVAMTLQAMGVILLVSTIVDKKIPIHSLSSSVEKI